MSQSIRGSMKGKKTGTPRSRVYAVPKNGEREIDRPSRGIGKRSDSNRRQRPSTGARAEHDRRVATRRGTLPSVGDSVRRIGPAIKKDLQSRKKR